MLEMQGELGKQTDCAPWLCQTTCCYPEPEKKLAVTSPAVRNFNNNNNNNNDNNNNDDDDDDNSLVQGSRDEENLLCGTAQWL